MTDSDNFFFDN